MNIDRVLAMGRDSLVFFVVTFTELTVLFIGISFLVGVLTRMMTTERSRALLSARRGRGYLVGAGLGALTPFCSCSTIPLVLGFLRAGAGFGPTLVFLLTSPLVNPVVVGLFVVAFGMRATAFYVTAALGFALVAGFSLDLLGFHRFVATPVLRRVGPGLEPPTKGDAEACGQQQSVAAPEALSSQLPIVPCCGEGPGAQSGSKIERKRVIRGRWQPVLQEAIDQFRAFLPHVLVGVGIGALTHGFVPADFLAHLAGGDSLLAVLVAAGVGVPLYVRASTMIPIGMALMAKGVSAGVVVALVIAGAGASVPEVVILSRLFRPPLLGAFLLVVFSTAVISGVAFNFLF